MPVFLRLFISGAWMNRQRILGIVAILVLVALAMPASLREMNRVYLAPIQAVTYWELSVPVDSKDARRLKSTVDDAGNGIERAVNNTHGRPCVLKVAVLEAR